jgi:hypothetical protein
MGHQGHQGHHTTPHQPLRPLVAAVSSDANIKLLRAILVKIYHDSILAVLGVVKASKLVPKMDSVFSEWSMNQGAM